MANLESSSFSSFLHLCGLFAAIESLCNFWVDISIVKTADGDAAASIEVIIRNVSGVLRSKKLKHYIIEINIFRGDQTDATAEAKTLAVTVAGP